MQKLLLILIGLCLASLSYGQSIKSYVITSAGTSLMSAEGGMYISVGEPMNTEIEGPEIMVSQGFLQIVLSGNSTATEDLLEEQITVYPNPTSANVLLDMPESEGTYQVLVHGQKGELIRSVKVVGQKNTLDFSDLTQGTYYMNVVKDNKQSETLKILKIK